MKNIVFIVFFMFLTTYAFSQQFLWSTVRSDDIKYVSLNNVTREVLAFYDQYDYYFDYSGFNKESFFETFGSNDEWNWIDKIEEMTVFAIRTSFESGSSRGSAVFVICISSNNVNMIIFSNILESGYIITSSSRRTRFENWFKTLIK